MEKYLMAHFLIAAKQTLLKKNIGKRLPWQYFTMKCYTLFIVWWRKRDLTAPWLKVLTVCELGTQEPSGTIHLLLCRFEAGGKSDRAKCPTNLLCQ